ncbi:MAG: 50S ribosomal protein L35 [Candidatus Eremiobacteraeota bacterium]|nr:50S ribosomal protein L35 [Candidatus Eremiobacteraeota bacterium]
MPKIKTRRAVAKRVKVTGSGKIRRMKQFSGCKHIREKKSPKRVRNIRKTVIAAATDVPNIEKNIPYML